MSLIHCSSRFLSGSSADFFSSEQQEVRIPELVKELRNSQQGQPEKSISVDFLAKAVMDNSRQRQSQ